MGLGGKVYGPRDKAGIRWGAGGVTLTCAQCRNTFERPASQVPRGAAFCTRDCMQAFREAKRKCAK